MAFELSAWLKELNAEGALTPEELASLTTLLGRPAVTKVLTARHEDGLRQADYSANMNALKKKEEATLALQGELVRWKQTAEGQIQQLDLTAKQERDARQAIEAKFRQIATDYGLDPTELGIAPTNAAAGNGVGQGSTGTQVTGTAGTTTGSATGPSKLQELETAVIALPFMAAELFDIQVEQAILFPGKPLTDVRGLVDRALKAGTPLRKVWEDENKVAERRTQQTEEAIQARIDTAVAKREAEVRSEQGLPPLARPEQHSPVLTAFKPPSTQQIQGTQETIRTNSGVDNAVAAYIEHRYAPGSPATGPKQ